MWLHATADIQQQQDINRHALALKVSDLLLLSVYSQDEILDAETTDWMIFNIHHLCIYTPQGDITPKGYFGIIRCAIVQRGGCGQQAQRHAGEKSGYASHEQTSLRARRMHD